MTYYLTAMGTGIATDRTPCRDNGKVLLTFKGEFADSLFVGGRFYPIVGGLAELPSELIGTATPLTAHALTAGRRYVCDPLGRLGEEGELIAPLPEEEEGHLVRLAIAVGELTKRLHAAEEQLRALDRKIHQPPITFGGTV